MINWMDRCSSNDIASFPRFAMDFATDFLRLVDSLNRHRVEYVLIGGAALNVHGLVRATEDVDIFVEPTARNIEALKEALHDLWNDASIDEIEADDLLGAYPVIRYGPPEGSMYFDILTRIGEFTQYDELSWEVISIQGVDVRVATPRTLFELKKNTVRPIDHADAQRLADAFGLSEED